ncbi:MAG: molybdopterin-dependent oxidoreductase [Rhodomicrobiaceae bacterium]
MSDVTKTTCPYCGVGCGVLATRQADGPVTIAGDPDHPANFGRLCSKGSALGETVGLEDRLLHPEIHGRRANWDEALDLVAARFSEAIREHGPDSVAFYVSGQLLTEDYYVANKLMKGFIGSANIDTNSRLCMASSVAGHRRAFGTDTVPGIYEDLELADLVVLVGSNLAWCHPVLYQRIAAAKEQHPHMRVVLIDPRRTMTADIADMHLAIAPDGDVALFSGLLAWLAERGILDRDYINQHTNGIDEALETSRQLTMDEITCQTGLERGEIEAFYALFARTEKTVTVYSQGVNQSSSGTDKVNAIINCHLATGRIGRPGMGPFSITGQPNAMGGREVGGLANMLAAHMDIENAHHRALAQQFWSSPVIADKPGLKAVDMFRAVADGRIKALWIMATNPVDSLPEADAVQDALCACPFVVVSDVLAETDTIRHAHIKLPSAAWGEKDGTVTNSERRISRQRAFLPMPGEARADWWQMAEVGRRMGYADAFAYESPAQIFSEYAAQTAFINHGARDLDIGAYAGIGPAEYDALTPFQWPQPKDAQPTETRFFANGGFFTPDRRARFVPVHAQGHARKSDAYPLTLNTGRIRDQWHTMTRTGKSPRLSAHIAEPFVELHPNDAASLAIADADIVRVESPHGAILVRGLITSRQAAGSVFVPMHWTDQFASRARVDTLVPSLTDPHSGQPASKNAAVRAERFAAAFYGFAVTHRKPRVPETAYWAIARNEGGWSLELAGETSPANAEDLACHIFGLEDCLASQPLAYVDEERGDARIAFFKGSRFVGGLYLSKNPIAISRTWVCEQLTNDHPRPQDRYRVLAGRAAANMPEKGPIVCACFSVGRNEIDDAVQAGCGTVSGIGKSIRAGMNCGSCRAEIQQIINERRLIAAE